MLTNLWYVAEWSKTVKDKPVRVKMLGQNFVLFRDKSGKVNCLSDVCIHRGGSLSKGWTTKRDCVACPYHGWEFDAEGKVQFIPSRGEGSAIPERARIDAYPTEERYGMIWVFLGDLPEEERYPIPEFPEYEDKANWRPVEVEYNWEGSVDRVVENGIDIAHTAFVHPGFGYPEMADKNEILKVNRGEYWGSSDNVLYPPQLEGNFGLNKLFRADKAATYVTPAFYLPGHCVRLHIKVNSWMEMIIFDANTPIDENTTRSFAVQVRNFFKWPIFDGGAKKRTKRVFGEDGDIVADLSPNYLPESLEHEVSVEQDKFMSAWRMIRRKHIEEKGWKIDTKAMKPYEGEKVFTIPSPARRLNPHFKWALDTVPLIAPTRRAVAASAEEPASTEPV
ncbi:aromatic ring-hydroxylating dioxygenase subunit alpha [Microbulbifer agarilyticus]|uniref:aromatic ring-hydroxylating dioxygenase subunit alpha n=1 Tax=Microbulbifer agarilyticus TaxID=260552 RepID=UPI001CD7C617|nr:aromatic ring-hydroxylating dioxygenase subunit alpha [Microbulbifer agarilyticus]MCA0900882.1 aromatic ring-hydroxylating dioxygenase subunit alpha [Microbulbifer agarilyticus]